MRPNSTPGPDAHDQPGHDHDHGHDEGGHGHDKPPKPVEITIDQETFTVRKKKITAEELRALPEPDIGPDRDLYLEGHGNDDDDLIEPGEIVELKKRHVRFFTAPASITPGCAA